MGQREPYHCQPQGISEAEGEGLQKSRRGAGRKAAAEDATQQR